VLARGLEQLDARHSWHTLIDEKHGDLVLTHDRQGHFRALGRDHVELFGARSLRDRRYRASSST
jgi:hypothetical protein